MKPLIFIFALLLSIQVFPQGCSDAGFCTMGAMKPDQPYNKNIPIRLRSVDVSFYRGSTSLTPVIYVATLDANFSVGRKNTFQVKLPFQAVSGSLANTSGAGDISLCFTRNIFSSEKFDVSVSLGSKIPTNKSDKTENGFPLPMYYQTSLGTYDAIAGIAWVSKKWLFATGIQVPLNKNNNAFLWGKWAGSGEDMEYIEKYARANQLKRGIDVMLRIERNFRYSRINFSVGLLPIYRITNDEIELGNGQRIKPEGAKGLALSAIGTVGYSFNVKSGVKLLIGHKLTNRDENPDGLTRELVSSVSYFYRF
ncbi:MAG TPA: hypothetical protein VFM90_07750 [Cyclobacteriaceae bacterium]|nr:hypothetical protein [Cyclobacteriaceae bacterium]